MLWFLKNAFLELAVFEADSMQTQPSPKELQDLLPALTIIILPGQNI